MSLIDLVPVGFVVTCAVMVLIVRQRRERPSPHRRGALKVSPRDLQRMERWAAEHYTTEDIIHRTGGNTFVEAFFYEYKLWEKNHA